MSGGQKVKETGVSNNKVELPAWMVNAGEQNFRDAQEAKKANPVTAYTGAMTAPLAANQQQASAVAAGGQNAGLLDLMRARGLAGAATGGVDQATAAKFDAGAAQEYANPFQQQVQQATLGEMDRRNRMELAGLSDGMAAGKAFGGTRHAVLEAETRKGQGANMLDYLARSNAQGFDDAANRFGADRQAAMQAQQFNIGNQQTILDRLLAASGQFASLGGQAANMRSGAIRDLLMTGGTEQDTANAAADAKYREFLRMQTAPLQQYETLASILSGTPRNVVTSGTTENTRRQSGSWINTLLGAGQIAASAFSDRRAKTDVELVAVRPDGLGVYSFRYVWDAARRTVGVMADEVARLAPEALGPRVFGFQTVNYAALGGVE